MTGNTEAFALLAQEVGALAHAVALAQSGSRLDAEDIAQDALLIAFERIDTCRKPHRFKAWVAGIVRRQARSFFRNRARRRRREQEATEGTPDRVSASDADRADVVRALARLSAREREVLLLYDVHGYRHAEIAAIAGISTAASRKTLSRARLRARTELSRE